MLGDASIVLTLHLPPTPPPPPPLPPPHTIMCTQGRWGTDKRESEAEVRRRRQFAEKRISAFRSEFVVLQDSFKVTESV